MFLRFQQYKTYIKFKRQDLSTTFITYPQNDTEVGRGMPLCRGVATTLVDQRSKYE